MTVRGDLSDRFRVGDKVAIVECERVGNSSIVGVEGTILAVLPPAETIFPDACRYVYSMEVTNDHTCLNPGKFRGRIINVYEIELIKLCRGSK